LLVPELFDLRSQFMNLGLQIVARYSQGRHWGIVNHSHRSQEYQSSNEQLHRAVSGEVNDSV
jgi:hypothetical protein